MHGGYLLATVGAAIRAAIPHRADPLAVSGCYLTPGPATVDVDVRRDGGSIATVSAELRQRDEARLAVLGTFGDLGTAPDDIRTTATEPDLPPRDR